MSRDPDFGLKAHLKNTTKIGLGLPVGTIEANYL